MKDIKIKIQDSGSMKNTLAKYIFDLYKYKDGNVSEKLTKSIKRKNSTSAKNYIKSKYPDYFVELRNLEMVKKDSSKNNINKNEYNGDVYSFGRIDGKPFEVIALNKKLGLVRVKNFSEFGVKEMKINEWIPYTFELGTPATFIENGQERNGEVVLRNGEKAISLYKDSNYSGIHERIHFLSDIDLSTLKSWMSSKEKFDKGGSIKSNNWLRSINEQRLNELKSDRAKYILELPEGYIEDGGTRRTKQQIINDYDVNITERENKFKYGGVTEEQLITLEEPSNKNKIIDVLVDGKIHSDILKEIIGHKPNYPCEYIDNIVLEKCFLIDYYRIK